MPRRHGAALIESAIVLVLLLTIVLGCIDFGRFAYTYIAVTNAAREGAYVASTHPLPPISSATLWEKSIRDAVVDELSGIGGFRAERLVVELSEHASGASDLVGVRVKVVYPFRPLVPWPVFLDEISMSRAVEMRVVR